MKKKPPADEFNSYDDAARAAAHSVVDQLFDHVAAVKKQPVVDWKNGAELRETLALNGEFEPMGIGALGQLVGALAANSNQLHHPSYMGHQVCPPVAAAAVADFAVSVLNQSMAVWEMSPGATVIEQHVVRWLADRVGYPASSAGTAVSGGSAANFTALLAARARWRHDLDSASKRAVIIASADSHYSIARAAAILGIPSSDVLEVPTDETHRIDIDELAATLEGLDSDTGVMAIVATASSTATGAFDHLLEISDLRDRHRTWLHVDAAHGASVLLSPSLRHLVAGLERADSLAWDPHKMLWMPLSLGVVLVRDGRWLRGAFEANAPYLFHPEAAEQNLGEVTIQCSRRADAVKLWIALSVYGADYFGRLLDHVTALTRELHRMVEQSRDFEAMHHPDFNIFCFRYVGDGSRNSDDLDALNARLRQRLIESGEAWITSTMLKGARALRVTIINPRTTKEDLSRMLDAVRRLASAEEHAR